MALEQLTHDELLAEACRLQEALNKEKKVSSAYAEELRRTREQNLAVQSQVEQEEEYITNKLMKRLEQLKKEKQLLATEVEQEEEFLTNTLQKKLEKLIKEKVDLENRLETEQEYVVNKLCKQLEQLSAEKSKLHKEKVDLENQLEAEQEYIMNKLQKQLEKLGAEKAALQRERTDLQRQCGDLSGAVDKLKQDKVQLENQMEMEEEKIVNRLQRQLEQLTSSYKALEGRLEARGLTLRDMGLQAHELPPENWASYTRSASRASSGELSRHSWGSMRTSSLGHQPGAFPLTIAAGGGGGGQLSGSMPSPSSLTGSIGRLTGDFLQKHRPGAGGVAGTTPQSVSSRRQSQQQQHQRPVSASSTSGGASGSSGGGGAAAGSPAAAQQQLLAGSG